MLQFIYYLKSIAALLITNSHFDNLYPVAALSIGGSLGNVLFFLASGFLMSPKMPISFRSWIGKKIKRIYSSLWTISLVLIVIGQIQISGVWGDLEHYSFRIIAFGL